MPLGQKFRNKRLRERFPRNLIIPHSDRIAEKRTKVNTVAGTIKNYGIRLAEWITYAIKAGWITIDSSALPVTASAIAINYSNNNIPYAGGAFVDVSTHVAPCATGTTTYALSSNPRFLGVTSVAEVVFDGTSTFTVRPITPGPWAFNYDVFCDGELVDIGTVSGYMEEEALPYVLGIFDVDGVSPLCDPQIAMEVFNMAPFGGLSSEVFTSGTALANRMNALNPTSGGWVFIDRSGTTGACTLEATSTNIPTTGDVVATSQSNLAITIVVNP